MTTNAAKIIDDTNVYKTNKHNKIQANKICPLEKNVYSVHTTHFNTQI